MILTSINFWMLFCCLSLIPCGCILWMKYEQRIAECRMLILNAQKEDMQRNQDFMESIINYVRGVDDRFIMLMEEHLRKFNEVDKKINFLLEQSKIQP